nr:hypothetical protein [Tanacetum cinerariifolium]
HALIADEETPTEFALMDKTSAESEWELSSGNAFALKVGKCTRSRIFITSSGNDLEHFIPNNPPLNLMMHLQSISALLVLITVGQSAAFTNLIIGLEMILFDDSSWDVTAEKIALLLKSSSNCQSKSYDSYAKKMPHDQSCILGVTAIVTSCSKSYSKEHQVVSEPEIDQQNPTLAKIPILDTGKSEQWQFRIQQYLQHEHYTLWEVIEFRDSYEVPKDNVTTGSASDGTGKKKGRTVALTTDDMQKGKNDVKARTTLLLALPDENQLRKKITIQGIDVAGFDKSKVECFNCHKMGYFARECRLLEAKTKEGKITTDKGLRLKNRLQRL